MSEAALLVAGILLFITGFYTGVWIARHSYVDREVPKMITTEKLVTVEKPVVIQVPQAHKPNGASLPVMGGTPRIGTQVLDPIARDEAQRQMDIIGQLPEV